MNRQPDDALQVAPALSKQRMTRYAAAGVVAGLAFPLIASSIRLFQLHLPISPLNLIGVQQFDPVLWVTDTAPFFLGVVAAIAGRQQDREMQANSVLQQRELELSSSRANLEVSVLERTRELDERNAQLRSVVTFARQIADIQDLAPLLQSGVDMIHERFQQYDASIYLLDERGQVVTLHASSTAEGRKRAAGGLRMNLADQGPVARVARRGKMLAATVRAEAAEHAGRMSTAALATSQLTLPLSVRSRVIGVLDLLLPSPRPVSQNETEIVQLMADQLAAAIETTRQATETRATIEQLEAVTAEATRAAWQQYLKNNSIAYQFTPSGVRSLPASEAANAGAAGVPLLLRGQRIGEISLRTRNAALAATERDLMEKVATQVALAIDNVRLLEETRQRAAQEQVIGEISARFSRSLDVDALLQAAVREFAALPEVAEATVLLKPSDDPSFQSNN